MEENTKCPICGTEKGKKEFKEVYVYPYNNQEYKRYECPNCEIHWWEPLKISPEFYESEVFEHYAAFHEVVGTRLYENHKAFFKYFPSNIRGRLLDVGCGDGRFLRYTKDQGFEVWGIDFDKKSVENIKRNLDIDTVFAMSLKEFYEHTRKKSFKFNVITFFEVLEHQDTPKEFLQMAKELLKEKGYIAGSVPNRDSSFWIVLHQIKGKEDYPPHHLLRFSKSSLEKVLILCGFKEVEVYKLDLPLKELFPYVEKNSLET